MKVILKVNVKNKMALFIAVKCAPKSYKLNVSYVGNGVIIIRKLDSDKELNLLAVDLWIKAKETEDIFTVLEHNYVS